ncbi:MAG: hypothetical protein AB1656_06510 [Candidatus Omnitrophota bacterium]
MKHPAKITRDDIVDQANAILKRKLIALVEEAFLSSTLAPTRLRPPQAKYFDGAPWLMQRDARKENPCYFIALFKAISSKRPTSTILPTAKMDIDI